MSASQTPAAAPLPTCAFGAHLRHWRVLRRLTQMDLAARADVSTRHLSCVETGRAEPSRELVLRLAHCLDVPIRERNAWLTAAGYAPMYRERGLDHADMAVACRAIQTLLTCHEPFPAIALDRHWNVVASNRASAVLLAGLQTPASLVGANIIRLCHAPGGLGQTIANPAALRQHHLRRLQQQIRVTADPVLQDLQAELNAYPAPPAQLHDASTNAADDGVGVVVPQLQVHSALGLLRFFTASTVFGSANDITLSEIAMELFLPADAATAAAVPRLIAGAVAQPG